MFQVQLLNYLELVRVSAQLSCWQLILVLHFHLLYGAHFLCGLYFNYFKLQCFKYTIPKLGVILGKHFFFPDSLVYIIHLIKWISGVSEVRTSVAVYYNALFYQLSYAHGTTNIFLTMLLVGSICLDTILIKKSGKSVYFLCNYITYHKKLSKIS